MKVIPIDDIDDFFKKITDDREAADARVEPWQADMKVGDHFVRIVDMGEPVVIYGVIEESPYEEDKEHYEQPHMKHFRMTRCFSVMCTEGEIGDTHVAVMAKKISPVQFAIACEMGWPSDSRLRTILNVE
jgi:hypothetical protein